MSLNTHQPQSETSEIINERKPSFFPPVTASILTICIAIHFGLALQNDYTSVEALARFGYLPASSVYEGGYWSLLTSAFVHFNFIHLFFNGIWVLRLGSSCERVMGPLRYSLFYATAAFISSSMQLAISGNTGIGASGVLYALFGFIWVTRRHIPSFSRVLTKLMIREFVAWLFICIGLSYFNILNIANTAHFSGVVFGMLVGAIVIRYQGRLVRIGIASAIVVSMISLVWNPWSSTWLAHKAYQAHVTKSYDRALIYYDQLLRKDSSNAWAYYNRGHLHSSLGYIDLAELDWEQAYQLDPTLAERETN